jgi:FkbM family methyltransferase
MNLVDLPEFIYTCLLKPAPLRKLANAALRALIPAELHFGPATVVPNPRDPVISGALTLRVYERPETRFFLAVCRLGQTFLDIGANVGYYTALAIPALGPSGRIVAFEPDPETFSFLQRTIAANTGASVNALQRAASDRRGSATLYISRDNRGDNRLYNNDLAVTSIPIETVPADDALEELGIESVDLVKIDVQGFEAAVYRGLERTIRRSPGLVLLSEYWPQGLRTAGSDPQAVLTHLASMGLDLHELLPSGKVCPLGDYAPFIARFPGRSYTNIVAARPGALPAGLITARP